MIPVTQYNGCTVVVFGLGVSGLSAARALQAGGARVLAWDDAESRRTEAGALGLTLQDPSVTNFSQVSALVLSPGIPLTHPAPHPVVKQASEADCPVIGDIELFVTATAATDDRTIVAVTGTNGKSTTTALIGKIVAQAGKEVVVAGNIGTPVLDSRATGPDGIYVVEMSSYQIDLTPSMNADVTVLLNITPDHLDRHGGMDGYAKVKAKLLKQQSPDKTAIVGLDDSYCRKIFEDMERDGSPTLVGISIAGNIDCEVQVAGGLLRVKTNGNSRIVTDLNQTSNLPGKHNWQNVAAAYAAASAIGVPENAIIAGIQSFQGLAHRMEHIAKLASVDVINDSKATNMDAAARALACYSSIYWIAGGRPKGETIDVLRDYFGNIRKAYVYGEAGPEFGRSLEGVVPCEVDETLQIATESALRDSLNAAKTAADPLVVMLSPACASFDQFSDFEARGEAFKDYVMNFAAGNAR